MGQPKGGPWKLVILNLIGKSQLPVSALLGSSRADRPKIEHIAYGLLLYVEVGRPEVYLKFIPDSEITLVI